MSSTLSHLPGARLEHAQRLFRDAMNYVTNPIVQRSTQAPPRVFVTISRQPGAGAVSLAHRLAERLRQQGEDDWSAWDRELLEKVSAEHGIPKEVLERIGNRHQSWVDDMVQSFQMNGLSPEVMEFRAYKHVVLAIRALAAAGHAIIVGQGGNFVTESMPQAIHVRLIAPLEYRIENLAKSEQVPLHTAAERVAIIDNRRAEFYKKYWQGRKLMPEMYDLTLNSAKMSPEEIVECILPIIRLRQTARAVSTAE